MLPRPVRGRRRPGHPRPRCRGHLVRDLRAGLQRRLRHARRPRERAPARPHAHRGRDPHERVPGTHDGDRDPRGSRALLRDHRQVGRRSSGHRPPDRRRTPHDRPPRTPHRRRRPEDRRPRGPRLRPPLRAPRVAGRAAGRHLRVACPSRNARGTHRRRARRALRRQPGLQGVGHRPVRPLRAGQHRPRPARRRGRHPHRRGHRPGCRALHGRERLVHQARPCSGRPPGPRRVVP